MQKNIFGAKITEVKIFYTMHFLSGAILSTDSSDSLFHLEANKSLQKRKDNNQRGFTIARGVSKVNMHERSVFSPFIYAAMVDNRTKLVKDGVLNELKHFEDVIMINKTRQKYKNKFWK